MNTITIDDFSKVEIRIGRVLSAEAVEGSDKLIKQIVDFGELGERTILSGVRQWISPEDMLGKLLPYVVNLEPRKIMGIESQGMLIAAAPNKNGDEAAVLITSLMEVDPGTKVI